MKHYVDKIEVLAKPKETKHKQRPYLHAYKNKNNDYWLSGQDDWDNELCEYVGKIREEVEHGLL